MLSSKHHESYNGTFLTCHHHILIPVLLSIRHRIELAQAARTVVKNHVTKYIAIDAKVASTYSAFISCTLAGLLFICLVRCTNIGIEWAFVIAIRLFVSSRSAT